MPINQEWLDLVIEDSIEPDLPICDPHHHFWDRSGSRYLLDELLKDTQSGHNIRSTVFVECLSMYSADSNPEVAPVGETEFVQGIAAQSASGDYGEMRAAAGIISFADLQLGEPVKDVLLMHIEASTNRFKGVRHSCSWDSSPDIRISHSNPPPQLYLDKSFRKGFQCLNDLGLVFDSWLYHSQLDDLLSLAQAFPDQLIILDHVGGPLGIGPYAGKQQEVFEDWKKSILALAQLPNINVKLGGLGMAINGFGWHKKELPPTSIELAKTNRPYIMTCIDAFGIDRCMFESNFPVDKVSASYNILWNSFKRITEEFSDSEKAKLYHDNAVRLYSLPQH